MNQSTKLGKGECGERERVRRQQTRTQDINKTCHQHARAKRPPAATLRSVSVLLRADAVSSQCHVIAAPAGSQTPHSRGSLEVVPLLRHGLRKQRQRQRQRQRVSQSESGASAVRFAIVVVVVIVAIGVAAA